ncbi:hypothetical protein M419DRAFT_118629 [Trichoderma reesei RUT C-30]|uniref:Uncharacterized protein n=1 Tax=Hypocrea jecorina (strain ATCC 56765 / BCRC 32924 / NRRL 11460 / Rut C-30) TaxID=1344414 RepID=A0A024SAD9_HYPJR|nr:hypothetical protein M419DRAFT_118629 [Trichoderma reesei RUT C-30]
MPSPAISSPLQRQIVTQPVVLLRDRRPAHRAPLWAVIARCIACSAVQRQHNRPSMRCDQVLRRNKRRDVRRYNAPQSHVTMLFALPMQ